MASDEAMQAQMTHQLDQLYAGIKDGNADSITEGRNLLRLIVSKGSPFMVGCAVRGLILVFDDIQSEMERIL